MLSRPFRSLLCGAALLLFATSSLVIAADEKADADKGEKAAVQPADVMSTWDKLVKRKDEITSRLQTLAKEHPKADLNQKKIIETEYNKIAMELRGIYGELSELAPVVIKKQPDNLDAAEIMLGEYYQTNQYKKAAEVADRLLKAGKNERLALNIGGASNFAIHNFKRAKELLGRAKKEDLLIREISRSYLEDSDEYQQLWDEEQKVRAAEAKADDLPRVELDTTKGKIVLEMFENEAPNAVANFIELVEKGFYDGIVFHRVIPGFMTQGGDPNTLDSNPGNDGAGGPGYTIACECYEPKARKHFQGSLSMAHAGRNTGGSQFFLTHLPTDHLNGKHTVFGRIVEGIDVNAAMEQGDKIKSAKVLRKRDHDYVAKKDGDKK